jgi:hypothetical protein
MPLQRLLAAVLPFMAGGALAIFLSELTRPQGSEAGASFPETWFSQVEQPLEHLWLGEPTFNWGD